MARNLAFVHGFVIFALSKDGSFAQGGMGEMNEDVSPKYVCKVLRVDNLLIKPDIVKDYAMYYE